MKSDMLALLREIDEPSETVSEYIHNDVTSGQLLLTQPFVPTFSTAMDSPTVVSFAPVEVLSRDLSIPMQPLDLPYANLDNTSYPSTKGVGEEQDHTDSTNWQTATDMLALQLFDDHSDDNHTGLKMVMQI